MPDIRDLPDVVAPDYPLADTFLVDSSTEMKAFADPVRRAIVDLVLERAATTTELAAALGRPKGTVDHHLKVLEKAGLVHVVRTRKVRAMTERYWGRTARTYRFEGVRDDQPPCVGFIRDALEEASRTATWNDPHDNTYATLRHARIAPDRMHEFVERLDALAVEFVSTERAGDVVYGVLIAVYPTDQPILAAPEATATP